MDEISRPRHPHSTMPPRPMRQFSAPRVPPPRSKNEFEQLAHRESFRNETLLDYFFPRTRSADAQKMSYFFPRPTNAQLQNLSVDVRRRYSRILPGCVQSSNCYCVHVRGSRDKGANPNPQWCEGGIMGASALWSTYGISKTGSLNRCTQEMLTATCKCTTGRGAPCLYATLNTGAQVSAIALARAAGVDHIIEEGREGGMSAFIYAVHGFRVTSVEYLPEAESTTALRQMAPSIALVSGDGSQIVPALVARMSDAEAARTMIFFDGEKRMYAHRTYRAVRERVGLAAFDDSRIPSFHHYLDRENETWWESGHDRSMADLLVLQGHGRDDGGTAFVVGGGWRSAARAIG